MSGPQRKRERRYYDLDTDEEREVQEREELEKQRRYSALDTDEEREVRERGEREMTPQKGKAKVGSGRTVWSTGFKIGSKKGKNKSNAKGTREATFDNSGDGQDSVKRSYGYGTGHDSVQRSYGYGTGHDSVKRSYGQHGSGHDSVQLSYGYGAGQESAKMAYNHGDFDNDSDHEVGARGVCSNCGRKAGTRHQSWCVNYHPILEEDGQSNFRKNEGGWYA